MTPTMPRRAAVVLGVALVAFAAPAPAATVQVAVAANFAGPMQRIAADFARVTGQKAVVTSGATGTFYAQIESGAPFDVLLAADATTPKKLESESLAIPGSRFAYAFGRLVLFSVQAGYVDSSGAVLRAGHFQHLAIANPALAPYGAAAVQTLTALGLLEAVRPKLVQGESVAQAHQFVASGNAELGFVALSQVAVPGEPARGSFWVVPAQLYAPIEQDAVLLRRGAENAAARALCAYLKTDAAREVIRAYGYGLPSN